MTGVVALSRPLAGRPSLLRRNRRRFSLPLVAPALALATIGLLVIYSVTKGHAASGPITSYMHHQLLFAIVGATAMEALTLVDYRRVGRSVWAAYFLLLASLVAVFVVGKRINGARAWFQAGGLQFEPSEFGKLVVILALAGLLGRTTENRRTRSLLLALGVAMVPTILILGEPDLGVALVYAAVTAALLFLGGMKGRHLLALAVFASLAITGAVHTGAIKPYQINRLTVFVDQNAKNGAAYNVNQAVVAVGSGGFTGQGLFGGTQTQLQQVPEQRTDFVFTAIGEELGFVGSSIVVVLYALLAWSIWRVAANAADLTGTLICAGALVFLVFHVFENIGMATGMMPVTGIPLPLISYGGSSVITTFAAVGLVLNVHHHTPYPD